MLSKGVNMKEPEEYEKRRRLIQAAKEEFLEKGYSKASLRTICSKAGVTTGALYFFFENKEDLFNAIVSGPLAELKTIVREHFKEDMVSMKDMPVPDNLKGLELNHDDVTTRFAGCIYGNYDAFMILLTGSENTMYENVVDDFVDEMEKLIPPMISSLRGYTCDKFMSHWMAHISADAYIHVIKHIRDPKVAIEKLCSITNYLVKGWIELATVKA